MAPKKETKNALVVERLHVILADADLNTMTVKNVQAKLESELKTAASEDDDKSEEKKAE